MYVHDSYALVIQQYILVSYGGTVVSICTAHLFHISCRSLWMLLMPRGMFTLSCSVTRSVTSECSLAITSFTNCVLYKITTI